MDGLVDPPTPTPVCSVCGAALPPSDGGVSGYGPCFVCLLKAGFGSGHGGDGDAEQVTQSDVATTYASSTAAAGAPEFAALPRRFAHYELAVEDTGYRSPVELGHGSMGVTYLARDTVLDCPVALKVIDARLCAAHPEARARFLREAKAAARLRHPNVASVFHYGEQDGHPFYVMEFIEGETLEARVRRDGPLPVELALEVTRQVTHALVAAEAHGIVHRDLKPANLMVVVGAGQDGGGDGGGDGDGLVVKVIDFGLAKAVAAAALGSAERADLTHGGFVGTPAFASPEQFAAEGEHVDGRSDIYSLGVTLWYLLTAKVPFAGRGIIEISNRRVHRPLPLKHLREAKVPTPVVTLLRGMLAADIAARPQSARELVGQLRRCREQIGKAGVEATAAGQGEDRMSTHRGRVSLAVGILALLVALAAVAALVLGRKYGPTATAAPGPASLAVAVISGAFVSAPEKSVAVLPFENLSADPANAFFADGVQEEILTDLARVADLKVISRTSVMQYRDAAKRNNLREIAAALGVTHVVEGSVQRAGNQVRVRAQLIDARTDAHRWAERYDRPLDDVFALQSEIAERIATSLRAKLSPDERAAIEARPTEDLVAYDLYLQARELVVSFQETADWRETLLRAVRLLDEATRRDGRFALAWCLAAKAHDQLYSTGLDTSPQRLVLQEAAVNTALRLQPDLGEAHLARALFIYRGRKNYEGARRELAIARAALPNNAEVFTLTSYIDRRLGRWPEALANQKKAFSLDPGNPAVLNDQTLLYDLLRMYREEIRELDVAIKAVPGSSDYYQLLMAQALLSAGQTVAARGELDALPPRYDSNGGRAYAQVCLALYQGQTEEATGVLAAFQGTEYSGFNSAITPRAWLEALVARAAGDDAKARVAMLRARENAEMNACQRPEDPFALALLGQIDAGLGRKDDALRAGRQAVKTRPVWADAMDGPGLETALALICTWTGEADEAMQHLLTLANTPGGPDYGQLRNDPMWAPLRTRADYQGMLTRLDPHLERSEPLR